MKIAISGKGGSGKTVFAASIGIIYAEKKKTYLIDADPDGNLGSTVGFSSEQLNNIKPISELKELILERTGVNDSGVLYKLNPEVSDIPEKYSLKNGNLYLLILGTIKKASSGCYCPENSFLKALLTHLILNQDEVVILDFPAGIEHLTRGTAKGIDKLYIMVEPTSKSVQTAERIVSLATELGIKNIIGVGNKISTDVDIDFIKTNLQFPVKNFVKYDTLLTEFEQRKRKLTETNFFKTIMELKL